MMLIFSCSIALSLFLFSLISSAQGYHWDGHVLYDLEYQGTAFDTEAESWTSSPGLVTSGVKTTTCGSNRILGGYNIMAGSTGVASWSKTYSALPEHNTIYFKGKFYMIDQWATNSDHFHLRFDSFDTIMWWIYSNYASATVDKCGDTGYYDLDPLMIYFTVSHKASSLTFLMSTDFKLTSAPQSVGFRDITMTFAMESPAPSNSYCGVAGGYGLNNNFCTCGTGTTMTPPNSGICTGCDSSCLTCNGAGNSMCTSCGTKKYLSSGSCYDCHESCETCNGPGRTVCTSCQSSLLLPDGSCCHPSCATCSGIGSSECTSCADDEDFHDGSCYSCDSSCETCNGPERTACISCESPLTLSEGSCCDPSCATCSGTGSTDCASCASKKYLDEGSCFDCDSTCAECTGSANDQCTSCIEGYYLVGSTCYKSCDAPLVKSSSGGIAYCETPCVGQYAYLEGGCGSCDSPRSKIKMNGFNVCGFPCTDTSMYFYWNGSCFNNCPFPLSRSSIGVQNSCNFPCSSGSDYLYWDGTCKSSCPSPYIPETQGKDIQRKFCWFPCKSNEYLYWNGSCKATCSYPLKYTADFTGAQTCINPCGTSSNYLYQNQTCIASCPSPLSKIVNPGVQFCVNPCSSGYFLYENKTCIGNCLSPFLKRFEPNVQYCDRPCDPGLFWYKNASCIPDCKVPYVQTTYSGVLQCLPPCPDSEFFYEFEKGCDPQCESPFKVKYADVIKICYNEIPISLSETTKVKGAAAGMESQGDMASGGMKAAGAMNSGSPSSALLAGLSSMLQYIRYMKINYPPKVQMLFVVSAGSPISLGFDFDIPESIAKKLDDNKLPDVFEKYDVNSNFVNNLWDFLLTLLMVLIVIAIFSVLKIIVSAKKYPRTNLILSKILGAIKWNVPIMMICSSSGDIFFYASLHIRNSPLNSFPAIMCFCVSLLMMIIVFTILVIGFKIMRSFKRQAENPNWADKWKGYEILFEEYEEKSIWSLAYMILFIIRGMIFNFTLANLFNFPLIQCIIINITNVLMLGYLLYLRPLKNFLNLVQLFVNEGLVNIIGVSIIILVIMDKAGISGQSTRVTVGDAIYFVIKVFNTFGLVFMGLGMLVFLVSLYRIWRRMKAQKIDSPMKIFKAMILGVKEESQLNLTNDPLKRAKIRKPPRNHPIQTANKANEVIYIEETEMSRVQMVMDISRTDLFGANTRPTSSFSPNVFTTEYREDVSDLQITELDQSKYDLTEGFDSPRFQVLSIEKSDKSIEMIRDKSDKSIRNRRILKSRMKSREASSFSLSVEKTMDENNEREISKIEIPVREDPKENKNHLKRRKKSRKPRNMSQISVEKSGVMEIKITETHDDNDKNKSDGFIQNWGRFKDRMKSRRTSNINPCQDLSPNETEISEIKIMENSKKKKTQNKSGEFIKDWGRLKDRMKAREPSNVIFHQEGKLNEKGEEASEREIAETIENPHEKNLQAWRNLSFLMSRTKNGADQEGPSFF